MSEKLSSNLGSFNDKNVDKTGLPVSYGDTKITILPKDPICVFAYWEISPQTYENLKHQYGTSFTSDSKLAIRIYDITNIQFNGQNANRYFDIIVSPNADNWYINVGEFNKSWCADIGYLTIDGNFIAVARSNSLNMPKHGVSSITDEQWAMLQIEFEKLLKISGVNHIGTSSFDLAKLMREKWEEIVAISLPGSHTVSSLSSFHIAPKNEPVQTSHDKPKSFWLKADTEIIVYGATEHDAKLTVQGKPVKLASDGSFSLRFYLPNGDQSYPIEATSSDGTMKKSITFEVKKDTK